MTQPGTEIATRLTEQPDRSLQLTVTVDGQTAELTFSNPAVFHQFANQIGELRAERSRAAQLQARSRAHAAIIRGR